MHWVQKGGKEGMGNFTHDWFTLKLASSLKFSLVCFTEKAISSEKCIYTVDISTFIDPINKVIRLIPKLLRNWIDSVNPSASNELNQAFSFASCLCSIATWISPRGMDRPFAETVEEVYAFLQNTPPNWIYR